MAAARTADGLGQRAHHHVPPETEVDRIARLLIYEAAKHVESLTLDGPRRWTSVDVSDLSDEVAEYVNFIQVARTRTNDTWASGWGNYPDVQPEELQAEITRKFAKASQYPSRWDGLWLLIYAQTSNEAQALDVTDEVRAAIYSGAPFDRVFFLDCRDRVAQLRLM